jgi:protein-histidine pros-kinase
MMLDVSSHREDALKCERLKVGARLIKPFSRADLRDALGLALHGAVAESDRLLSFDATQTHAYAPAESGPALKLKILLVEDNPVNQTVAVKMLEKMGHTLTVAGNGQEASISSTRKVRSHPDGRADAGDGRAGGHPGDPCPRGAAYLGGWRAVALDADRRDDGPRHAGRPRPLPGCRHGRLHRQADQAGRAARGDRAGRGRCGWCGGGQGQVEDGHIDFGADEAAADLDATRELLDGDEAALQQLIGLFFADLERNRKALEQAQRANDFTTLRNLAHSIKGSAGCSMPKA